MCTIGRISGGTARETYHCGNRKEGVIIAETERKVHYGTERKKRIAAPSGAVILF